MGRIVAKLRQAAIFGGRNNKVPGRAAAWADQTSMGEPKVKPHFPGAVLRALLVATLIILPAVLVPATTPESAQIVILLAIFAGGVILAEYASAYPGLIEFRFAAPYNRTRFMVLALSTILVALLLRHSSGPGSVTALVHQLAVSCAPLFDFAFSPVRLLLRALPDGLEPEHLAMVQQGASLSLLLGLTTVAGFAAAIRLNVWPMGNGPFNVWVNLPTFDPTAGSDVVKRLRRQARINIMLGIMLPFLLPGLVFASALLVQPMTLQSPMGFVWGIVLWAYLPVSLMMRGVALLRVARMIRANRRRFADTEGNAFATA